MKSLSSPLALVAFFSLTACGGGGTGNPVPTSPQSFQDTSQTQSLGFMGAESPSCHQDSSAIVLGAALRPFAVLAGSTITNVGHTLVTYAPGVVYRGIDGDLIGVSPGTAVTGFYPPGKDTDGTKAIYAAGYNQDRGVPRRAKGALTTAYNTAAGRPATHTVAGDLSQVKLPGYPTGTLPAGVYKSGSTLSIKAGNLTLDGGNKPQSVFIFQVKSAFKTTFNGKTSGNVMLIKGANPCNIYWQVGSSATLGGATFYGNVLAYSSITVNATAFTGRALARAGAVSIPVAGGSLITNPGGK